MWRLIVRAKRIPVSESVQGVVSALIFVVICVISMLLDNYVPGKSDAFTITSYGSFALMSVSLSRKFELGFETGFSAFSLQLFASQLFKIKWFLLPIALVFCFLIIILRHYSESGVQFDSSSANDYYPIEDAPLSESQIEISGLEDINEESQYSPEQSLSPTSNQENNQEEPYEAAPHSPSNSGGVSEEIRLEVFWDNNDQEETPPPFPAGRREE